ncbi:MAG: putative transcriptional regulator [uncultured archaeon A07HB70]|nr:MAG: putative transcriptional regulator [uncultured archaeon A07HB70]
MRVTVLCYDGFDELDVVGPYEVFQAATDRGADLPARLATLDSAERVTAAHGLRVEPDGSLPEPGAPDAPELLVVPGGGWNDRHGAGAWAEAERGAVPDAVAAHHAAGATVAGVCTGGMLLARAGLLDGRPATTHHGALDDLRATDAEVREERVVDDGDVLTAGGITSGIDLALHVAEREAGAGVADAVAANMEYARR